MATQEELVVQLNGVKLVLDKIAVEETSLLTKIEELKLIIIGMETVTPELSAAVQAVSDQAGVLDAIVPDVAP